MVDSKEGRPATHREGFTFIIINPLFYQGSHSETVVSFRNEPWPRKTAPSQKTHEHRETDLDGTERADHSTQVNMLSDSEEDGGTADHSTC